MHLRGIFGARLVIVVIHIILRLRGAPRCVVAFVLQDFADGKRRNAYAGQAEMVGAVVVPGFGTRIRSNRQVKCFCHRLHYWIKRGALRPAYFYFFGITNWCERIIIQVEGNFRGGNGGMLAQVFGAQQPLLFRADGGKENGSLRREFRERPRSEEHTSELQSPDHLVCRLLLEKKKKTQTCCPTTPNF